MSIDAGNGIGWGDDRQFTDWLARVIRNSRDPHTDLVVYVVRRAEPVVVKRARTPRSLPSGGAA